jgi:hypothetical protein
MFASWSLRGGEYSRSTHWRSIEAADPAGATRTGRSKTRHTLLAKGLGVPWRDFLAFAGIENLRPP